MATVRKTSTRYDVDGETIIGRTARNITGLSDAAAAELIARSTSRYEDGALVAEVAYSLVAEPPAIPVVDATTPLVAQFGGEPGALAVTSAYHGPFWDLGKDLGQFSWEFWSCRLDNTITGYLISEGYGGAHAVLFSANSSINGNVKSNASNIPFVGNYTTQLGEWVHSRCGWDGKFLHVWINGIHVGLNPFTGPRQAQQGTLWIGGSDHSNFTGRIAMARGFEDSCPIYAAGNMYAAWIPARSFAPVDPIDIQSKPDAQFCAQYLGTPTARQVIDTSEGYGGKRHHGVLVNSGLIHTSSPTPFWVADPTAPFNTYEQPSRTRTFKTPSAVPGGAKIFDSVGRADSIPAFTPDLVGGQPIMYPGQTEGGSLGPKTWQKLDVGNRWGVFDGALLTFDPTGQTGIYVTSDSPNMDVRVSRHNSAGWNALPPATISRSDQGLLLRYVDRDNYLFTYAYRDEFGGNVLQLHQRLAGVETQVASFTVPNYTWQTQRWVLGGTTVTAYVDATQIGQATGVTAAQAGQGVGLFHWLGAGTAVKATNFTVF